MAARTSGAVVSIYHLREASGRGVGESRHVYRRFGSGPDNRRVWTANLSGNVACDSAGLCEKARYQRSESIYYAHFGGVDCFGRNVIVSEPRSKIRNVLLNA